MNLHFNWFNLNLEIMKKVFLIIIIGLIGLTASSQVKFGIKAGASTGTVPKYDISTGENNIESLKDASFGFHAGAFLRITLFGVYVMPEVYFASTTYDYNVTVAEEPEKVLSQKFDKLEVPLLLGVTLGPVRINAGPSASILISSPRELIADPNFTELYRSATFGYQAVIGSELLQHLTIDLRSG